MTYLTLISQIPVVGDYLKNFIRLSFDKDTYFWEAMHNSSKIVNVQLISEGTYQVHTISGSIYIAQLYRNTNTYFSLVYDTPYIGEILEDFSRLRCIKGTYTWEEMRHSSKIVSIRLISEDNYEVHTLSGSIYIAQLHNVINQSIII